MNSFTWLHLDQANVVFSEGRKRVYIKNADTPQTDPSIPKGYQTTVEEQPKWRALIEVLREIEQERKEKFESRGSVLVICQGGRTSEQLRRIVSKTDLSISTSVANARKKSRFTSPGTEGLLLSQLYRYFDWKGGMANLSESMFDHVATSGLAAATSSSAATNAPSSKRRRVKGSTLPKPQTGADQNTFLDEARQISSLKGSRRNQQSILNERNFVHSHITIRAYSGTSNDIGNETPDSTILDYLRPQWIVMYDPDVAFVRRIEVFSSFQESILILQNNRYTRQRIPIFPSKSSFWCTIIAQKNKCILQIFVEKKKHLKS